MLPSCLRVAAQLWLSYGQSLLTAQAGHGSEAADRQLNGLQCLQCLLLELTTTIMLTARDLQAGEVQPALPGNAGQTAVSELASLA